MIAIKILARAVATWKLDTASHGDLLPRWLIHMADGRRSQLLTSQVSPQKLPQEPVIQESKEATVPFMTQSYKSQLILSTTFYSLVVSH